MTDGTAAQATVQKATAELTTHPKIIRKDVASRPLPTKKGRLSTLPKKVPADHKPIAPRDRWDLSPGLLAAGGVGAVMVAGAAMMIPDILRVLRRRLREWKKKVAKPKVNPTVLVATINGEEYQLGPAAILKTLHIGSGPQNALRIQKEGVQDKHLRLKRKGSRWFIKNLSSKPIKVNNTELAKRKTRQVRFPLGIHLAEKVGLSLSLLPIQEKNSIQEKEDGQHKA